MKDFEKIDEEIVGVMMRHQLTPEECICELTFVLMGAIEASPLNIRERLRETVIKEIQAR